MAKALNEKVNLKESLSELNEIASWFESQEEVDVEAGLEKIRRGAHLVKICKQRLGEIENEFETIRKEAESNAEDGDESRF